MKLKLTNDGKVVNAETGEEVENVVGASFAISDLDEFAMITIKVRAPWREVLGSNKSS